MLHKIKISGLEVYAHHGVYDFEREEGQNFYIDATIWVEIDEHNLADSISKTVNYGELSAQLVSVTQAEPLNLLESLAQRLLKVCLDAPGAKVHKAKLTVHKPQAQIGHEVEDISVTVKGSNG